MGIDASIALSGKPIQIEDPLNQMAAMYQLQGAQQNNQLNQMKLQEAQRGAQEQEQVRNYLRDTPNFDPLNPTHQAGLIQVAPTTAPKLIESFLTAKKTSTETDAAGFKLKTEKADKAINDIGALKTPEEAIASMDRHLAKGDIDQAKYDQLKSTLIANPNFQDWQMNMQLGIMSAKDKLTLSAPKPTEIRLGDVVKTIDTNPRSPTYKQEIVPAQKIGVSPDTAATNDRMVSEGAKNRANQLEIAKTRISRTGAQGLTPLEDDALAQAILDGRVDINKVNSRNAKLLSAAVLKDPTANLKEMSFENTGAAAGSRTLGTQQAKMVSAASEASKMIPIAQGYVTKVNPSDYPMVNSAGNYVASKTGDPSVAGLAATLNALVNSYSRAISPTGNPTVSDKNHAREVINSAMAKGQFNEVFTVMQQEMDAAKASPTEAAGILKGQRGKPAPAAPGIDALLDKYK